MSPWLNRTLHLRLAPPMNLRVRSGHGKLVWLLALSCSEPSIHRPASRPGIPLPKPLLTPSTTPVLPLTGYSVQTPTLLQPSLAFSMRIDPASSGRRAYASPVRLFRVSPSEPCLRPASASGAMMIPRRNSNLAPSACAAGEFSSRFRTCTFLPRSGCVFDFPRPSVPGFR